MEGAPTGHFHTTTPLLESWALSREAGVKVLLKCDNMQPAGSFKIRGIGHFCQQMAKSGCKHLVCSSGGNAGIAAAYSARKLGIPATIVLPETTSLQVVTRLQGQGAEVQLAGKTFAQSPRCASCHWPLTRASPSGYQRQEAGWARPQARTCDAGAVGSWTRAAAQQGAPQTWGGGPGKPPQKGPLSWVLKEKYESSLRRKGTEIWDDANLRAQELAKRDGWVNVPPFDHPLIWEGNASLVRELKATLGTPPGAVVLAVGGGGLLAGVVAGLVEVGWQHVPIIAMETRGAHSFNAAVEAGKLVTLPDITSVAKSLGAKTVAARALECTRECRVLSEVVDDAEAVSAVQRFLDDERLLVEPACGAALAFIYSGLLGRLQAEGRLGPLASVVVIVCGGNGINSGELQALKAKLGQS
ncbi:serine dehydratase-like isoform X1 [Marmota monax]|uniref:serine dehydratase-like isoform X1 n=1 Tax=Marmota monax TaxID=9995 RepID=UPI001EAFB8DA|nr:serine dehydratase-like isoform X1 [Marmota monax]XP_046312482.1 serine dehydratase-like isoform X1 [Marmota monax]XP_046312483.1 serine dehydratase-like isoform X1 [Marmota monax]XP_046312484.1 serine dehydratase-like isoform X1 [Marmota monax]